MRDSDSLMTSPAYALLPGTIVQSDSVIFSAVFHDAAECGLSVAMEPIRKAECSLLNLVSEATLIAGLLQLENVGVAANAGHMAMASEPLSALRRAAPLLRHVHLENALTRKLPKPYDGEDYARLLRTLAEVGYAGGVSLCGQTQDFAGDAGMALEYLRGLQAVRG